MSDSPRILTLTTDFGMHGPYVASIKGVVLGLVPDVHLVDVSHAIGPQNVVEGAFVLSGIVNSFPPGTVHLAVVDPGVGTARRLVAAQMGNQWFVAPDNGLLGGIARTHPPQAVYEIDGQTIRRSSVSYTFHGRDILAPAAAHLLLGKPADQLGPSRHGLVTLPAIEPRRDNQHIVGEVVFRDTFGNLITNVPAAWVEDTAAESWRVEIAGQHIQGLSRTYGDHPPGTLISLAGSQGFLEIAMVNGDAARYLDAGPGATVWFRRSE